MEKNETTLKEISSEVFENRSQYSKMENGNNKLYLRSIISVLDQLGVITDRDDKLKWVGFKPSYQQEKSQFIEINNLLHCIELKKQKLKQLMLEV